MNVSHDDCDLNDELRPHYDFSQMKGFVRGKYAKRFAGVIVQTVVLDPDIAPSFPDAASVNAALRQYLKDHPQPSNPA